MMEDILVNITTNDCLPKSIKRVKKGRWIDRVRSRKAHKHWVEKSKRIQDENVHGVLLFKDELLILGIERNVHILQDKQDNLGVQSNFKGKVSSKPKRLENAPTESELHSNISPKFISSLFTSNPKIEIDKDAQARKPSGIITNAPNLQGTFDMLNPRILSSLKKLGIEHPTVIQEKSIPHLLQHHSDLFISSQTGSGKTLAYLLPIIHSLLEEKSNRADGISAIILVPTRELSRQIQRNLDALLPGTRLVSVALSGGEKKKSEKSRLRKGGNIIVSTPGRFLDHLENTECLNFRALKWVIMDEGDRLMDLGFEETIEKILRMLKERKNGWKTILCSATMQGSIESLSSRLDEPVLLSLQKDESAPGQLEQIALITPVKLRLVGLHTLLSKTPSQILVFVSCTAAVDFLAALFSSAISNRNIFKLHGNLLHEMRIETISDFSKDERGILFCTDVAARGLDLTMVQTVVQYDAPFSAQDYVHRIGRTARVGRCGRAYLFLSPIEAGYNEKVGILSLQSIEEVFKQFLGVNWQDSITKTQLAMEQFVLKNGAAAREAYLCHVRAYATHIKEERQWFGLEKVHLGHLAKSFGLREKPTELGKRNRSSVGKSGKSSKLVRID